MTDDLLSLLRKDAEKLRKMGVVVLPPLCEYAVGLHGRHPKDEDLVHTTFMADHLESAITEIERLRGELERTVWAAVDYDDYPDELYRRILEIAHYDPSEGTRAEAERQMRKALNLPRSRPMRRQPEPANPGLAPWVCPKCRRVYSGLVFECHSCNKRIDEHEPKEPTNE